MRQTAVSDGCRSSPASPIDRQTLASAPHATRRRRRRGYHANVEIRSSVQGSRYHGRTRGLVHPSECERIRSRGANQAAKAERTQSGCARDCVRSGWKWPDDRESIDTVLFGRRSLSSGKPLLPPDARISDKGSLSPDGSEIALNFILDPGNPKSDGILTIIGRDGHLIRIYPCMLDGSDFCFSPDNSKLVLQAIDKRVDPCNQTLQVLDLNTGLTRRLIPTNESDREGVPSRLDPRYTGDQSMLVAGWKALRLYVAPL